MDSKKKVLIAIIIIILLSLTIFAFAGSDDEEEGLKEGNKTQQVDKKDNKKNDSKDSKEEKDSTEEEKESENKKPSSKKDKDSKKDKESKENEEGTGETEESKDEAYEKALELVKKAEESLTREDLEAAREAVKAVPKTNTDELDERLDNVESDIDARELVEALEKLVEEAENKDDIDEARKFDKENKVEDVIAAVNNAELKEELEDIYSELEEILSDTTAPEVTGVEDGGFYNELNVDVKDDTHVTVYVDGEETELPLDVEELGDGEHTLVVVDEAFNESEEITFTVDTVAPTAEVEYDVKPLTNGNVVATLTNASEDITVTNNEGNESYTFEADGEFTFEFKDNAGNTGSVTATVDWIDKDAPVIEFTGGSIIKDKYSIEPIVITVRDKKLKSLSYIACEIKKNDKENCAKKAVEGFEKVEDGVYQKVINPSDLGNGNQAVYRLKVTAVDSFDKSTNVTSSDYYVNLKSVKVEYSTTEPTNQGVVVTISAPKKQTISTLNDGWTVDKKNKKLTKTFNTNGSEKVIVKCSDGTILSVDVKVENIDKVAPELVGEVSYSTKELTNGNVTVTIEFNEDVVAPKGWTADGNVITKVYYENAKAEQVVVKDLAGNQSAPVEVDAITNIDKTGPVVVGEVEYSKTTPTKDDVKVTITFDEDLKADELPTDWELVDGSTTKITTTFDKNTESGYSIKVKDLLGNESNDVVVTVANIDKVFNKATVSYDPKVLTNGNVKVIITADEELQALEGWTLTNSNKSLSLEVKENSSKDVTVTIKDLAGNSQDVTYNVTNIDRVKPTLKGTVQYSETKATNKDVVVTMEFSEALKNELPKDWSFVQGSTTKITRTFDKNTESGYSIKVKDLAGNESDSVTVTITNIDKEVKNPKVSYNPADKTAPTQKVVVTISADEDLQDLAGWKRVDAKSFKKEFDSKTSASGSVTIKDVLGNEKEVAYDTTGYTFDNTKPTRKGEIKYEKDDKTGNVIVTIEFSEDIVKPEGWNMVEGSTTKITKTYTENKKESVKVKDLAGNESDAVEVNVTNAGKEEVKKPVIKSATYRTSRDKGTDKMTITATVEGSYDKLQYRITYEDNKQEKVTEWKKFVSGTNFSVEKKIFDGLMKVEVKAIDNDTKLESDVVEATKSN